MRMMKITVIDHNMMKMMWGEPWFFIGFQVVCEGHL